MEDLVNLAKLLNQRNKIDSQISNLIGRPAMAGHLGEFIASKIFEISLMKSASHKGFDGHFNAETLAGRSVNIKLYSEQQGILDIPPDESVDFFLVLTGPKSKSMSSRGQARPFCIESVFLFDARVLVAELRRAGVKIGIATSVKKQWWEKAEIYPIQRNREFVLAEKQQDLLGLFGSKHMLSQ